MISLLDSIGPAVWRASWQAAALAVLVYLLARCCGERLSPRWRFLLWGVVLTRLLFVATPASPWSVFNLVPRGAAADGRPAVQPAPEVAFTTPGPGGPISIDARHALPADLPEAAGPAPQPSRVAIPTPANTHSTPTAPETASGPSPAPAPPVSRRIDAAVVVRILSAVWLAGCVVFGAKLLAGALVLRRRLSACRPVTDAAVLKLLDAARRRLGVRRAPALLVTPECISPCVVGTWNPRIVLPEALVTDAPAARLRHVLAHELAHLVRGDLWTNWLLLAARVLHWFNPVAWWTVREMQAEREAARDELAFAALGEADRSAYAATIVDLAARLSPSGIAPGLIGLFSSACRVRARVERLLRFRSVATLRTPVAASLLLGIGLLGLTDAMPRASAQPAKEAENVKAEAAKAAKAADPAPAADADPQPAATYTLTGRCVENADGSPMAGVSVRLYRVDGRTSPPVEIARTDSDADGRYSFANLVPPRAENHLDRMDYGVFGFAEGRPIGISFFHFDGHEKVVEIQMARERSTLAGRVVDAKGRPVKGATVVPYFVFDRPAPDLASATTDADGRFKLEGIGVYEWLGGKGLVATNFDVIHPDHPTTRGEAKALPADVVVRLPAGCVVTGTVTDDVTGQPAAGALITARRSDQWGEAFANSDGAGRFRAVVPEGRYDFLADASDRVCVAVTERECLPGEPVELPPFNLIAGGFIAGRVVNTATGQPVTVSEFGGPVMLGLFGPSQPVARSVSPARLAAVDAEGRFTLRAVPGDNFPYLVNIRGDRMTWDTLKQPPVVVTAGETTPYDMLITPEVSPADRLKAARALVAGLPKEPAERTAGIVGEFRKLNHTVDETELWCLLMRELVAVGRDAVPQLAAALDQTTDGVTLRRLAFALRAIGDARAVPALVRALPRTLLPSGSDYGLIVGDKELADFMKAHDLDAGAGSTHFSLGRPVREVVGALHALTKQDLADAELFSIGLSEDPRRQVLQRRVYARQAQRWQAWWEANWASLTDDAAYQKVNLDLADEPLPPAAAGLGKTARLHGEWQGAVLSPARQGGEHAWHFYDLDTGYRPFWPAAIARDEAAAGGKELTDWATQRGVDLMCVTHRAPDGTETYVLRALGMTVREISARDLRNLDRLIAAGTLPEGRPVDGELLMHFDPASKRLVPAANAAFLFVTHEGSMGLIEVTGRVTRTSDVSGLPAGSAPGGVGFHLGVQFNLNAIVP